MNTHIVNYDLLKPGQSYTTLIARLTQLGAKRILFSTWMVQGTYTCRELRDDLKAYGRRGQAPDLRAASVSKPAKPESAGTMNDRSANGVLSSSERALSSIPTPL